MPAAGGSIRRLVPAEGVSTALRWANPARQRDVNLPKPPSLTLF